MTAIGAEELPIKAGAMPAIDIAIAAIVRREKVSPIVDQSRD